MTRIVDVSIVPSGVMERYGMRVMETMENVTSTLVEALYESRTHCANRRRKVSN